MEKACDSGNARGCSNLGFLYDEGQDVNQNFSTAKQYYSKACDLGLQLGCDNYRKLNEKGY
ncbi:tetratricopeptide repeat protein [Campylobacter concisus]|uniref:tetratricopeptide repeat protein n=1 Tax=Campylobacter concisus TaxID=199 RepID=UPI00122CAF77